LKVGGINQRRAIKTIECSALAGFFCARKIKEDINYWRAEAAQSARHRRNAPPRDQYSKESESGCLRAVRCAAAAAAAV